MPDREFAREIREAISLPPDLTSDRFQVNRNAGANVARLITTMLRAKLPGRADTTAKTSNWNGGEVAFKNLTVRRDFWTKVTQNDLDAVGDRRAWVCSSIDPERAVLHVWVIPFSTIRDQYAYLPEDAKHRRDLQISVQGSESSFRFAHPPAVPPALGAFHQEFSLRGVPAFEEARAADAARKQNAPPTLLPPQDGAGSAPNPSESQLPEAVDLPGINRIHFGPPGTGKSRQLHDELGEARHAGRVETVTFHPEYTYGDFVGSYRPTMVYGGNENYQDGLGNPIHPRGRPAVVYRFVPGPLVRTVCRAVCDPGEHFYLVIEEINRGNCAAIFGDLFHLLDRQIDGESTYAVRSEHDLMAHVAAELAQLPADSRARFEREGLFIPSNLSIFATMNTSDQSLYPMDSAMKRRWDMRYVPINYQEARGRLVLIRGYGERDWSGVLQEVNRAIVAHTNTDDKQIGQWFVNGQTISEDSFRDKVLSYLWFDVFRHSPQDIFDLGDDPYSYESLVAAYDARRRIFRDGILTLAAPAAQAGPNGE